MVYVTHTREGVDAVKTRSGILTWIRSTFINICEKKVRCLTEKQTTYIAWVIRHVGEGEGCRELILIRATHTILTKG